MKKSFLQLILVNFQAEREYFALLRQLSRKKNGKNAVFTGEPFYGADAVAAFGALEIDLRGSVITEDIIISTGAVFGGVDIFLPQNVNAELCVTPVFGGVANKTGRPFTPGIPTVFVTGVCAFGGIDVK